MKTLLLTGAFFALTSGAALAAQDGCCCEDMAEGQTMACCEDMAQSEGCCCEGMNHGEEPAAPAEPQEPRDAPDSAS